MPHTIVPSALGLRASPHVKRLREDMFIRGPLIVCIWFSWATLPCIKEAHEKQHYLHLITLRIILLLLMLKAVAAV